MSTNIHNAPAEGNFCTKGEKAIKPQIVTEYNRHMGYVDKGDRMANNFSISRRTFKWTKKLFFRLLELAILNSHFLHYSCCQGKIISQRFSIYAREEYVGASWVRKGSTTAIM
jgi:hypothetical protein